MGLFLLLFFVAVLFWNMALNAPDQLVAVCRYTVAICLLTLDLAYGIGCLVGYWLS